VFEEQPTFIVSHAVNIRRSVHLQLEVQRPEYFGGVWISFPEPGGAHISVLKNFENLPARPSDGVTLFTQGRQFQLDAIIVIWRAL
jgi:hypothetical protein